MTSPKGTTPPTRASPPRPTAAECKAHPGLMGHWMELTWDIATIEAFKELHKDAAMTDAERGHAPSAIASLKSA